MELRNAHAFVVGGSTGVGAALTQQLADEGAKLTVLALDSPELDEVGARTGAATIPADLSDPDVHDGLIARAEEIHGPVDVLVCMAAICPSGPFQEYSAKTLRDAVTINMLAHMELVRQVLPGMIDRGAGTITATGSLSSEMTMIHLGGYVPTKAGLTKFAVDLGSEVRDYGIRVFAFLLGSVKGTPLATSATEDPVVRFLEERAGDAGVLSPEAVSDRMVEVLKNRRRSGAIAIPRIAQPLLGYKALPSRAMDPLVGRPARREKRKTA